MDLIQYPHFVDEKGEVWRDYMKYPGLHMYFFQQAFTGGLPGTRKTWAIKVNKTAFFLCK